MGLFDKLFGNYSEKEIKKIMPLVEKVNGFEETFEKFSDDELKGKTEEFKQRYKDGETLDEILPEAFANVREAAKRVYGMRHYDVQVLGGIILHQGRISEMKTGEGKTLVSTLPAYLNALTGDGVHIVTVNDYLAKRDSEWMGAIHEFLGLTVGVVLNSKDETERQKAYACDITYATNNELGFDYLRDNMVVYKERRVQRGLNYAIIDEVDSVLIDEARTPLIISGGGKEVSGMYKTANAFARSLEEGKIVNEREALNPMLREEMIEEGDFVNDEKGKSVTLTGQGIEKAEKYFRVENLSDPENLDLQHYIQNALKANYSMHLDQDYVVQEGEIVIVDEFTGRLMPGRRYSNGLHQAIEEKESVEVKRESKTLATVTFQNYFNKYSKKAGMTGTALTEESEFREIYLMDVVAIPTNEPIARVDNIDIVYQTIEAKFRAIIEDVKESAAKGQPVLIGTTTIEMSEALSKKLKEEKIPHNVLNAKYHEKEAAIVAEAGVKGAITIATNMAGRGTDIKLGEGVKEVGGLKIIGTERHESRRIDNQLRGRSGRQGDVGESTFYLALDDNLLRLFIPDRIKTALQATGLDEDEAIVFKQLTKAIENAQKQVEGNNFNIRKHLLDYDKIMNEQREVIYGERDRVLEGEDLKDHLLEMFKTIVDKDVFIYTGESEYPEEWDLNGLNEHFRPMFNHDIVNLDEEEYLKFTTEDLKQAIYEEGIGIYNARSSETTPEIMRELERTILLRVIDRRWMDHIDEMQLLRQTVSLRAYGQKDPLTEYKFASFDMFDDLIYYIKWDTMKSLLNLRDRSKTIERKQVANVTYTNKQAEGGTPIAQRKVKKIGRNDPCHCGSGKKFKNCCDMRA
ncbi:MAG: preprotein translocase subunit SecA [Lachnospirales bacterium]